MAVTISAVFDSVDMADLARARLRERGVEYADMEIEQRPLAQDMEMVGQLNVMANPFMPFIGGTLTDSFASLPATMQRYGNVIMHRGQTSVAGIANDIGMDGTIPTPRDVRMTLRVRNDQVKLAEGVLTACHGTKMRRG